MPWALLDSLDCNDYTKRYYVLWSDDPTESKMPSVGGTAAVYCFHEELLELDTRNNVEALVDECKTYLAERYGEDDYKIVKIELLPKRKPRDPFMV